MTTMALTSGILRDGRYYHIQPRDSYDSKLLLYALELEIGGVDRQRLSGQNMWHVEIASGAGCRWHLQPILRGISRREGLDQDLGESLEPGPIYRPCIPMQYVGMVLLGDYSLVPSL